MDGKQTFRRALSELEGVSQKSEKSLELSFVAYSGTGFLETKIGSFCSSIVWYYFLEEKKCDKKYYFFENFISPKKSKNKITFYQVEKKINFIYFIKINKRFIRFITTNFTWHINLKLFCPSWRKKMLI
jgi:hypothetical protein